MGKLRLAYLLPLLTGCWAAGSRPEVVRAARPPAVPPVGVVFVANGSGDVPSVTAGLSRAVEETAAPLEVMTFVWSHGPGRYIADQVDHDNHRAQGERLAAEVASHCRAHAGLRVCLLGHSAGCAVVLAAAEVLPPGGVDRIVLLAPSMCVTYDLRPALRTARRGVDVFYSSRDWVVLGLGMQIVGTADRGCRTAAGRFGFTPVIASPADAALYGRLRQHPWEPAVEWSGNRGGHYGSNRPDFLRAYVLPLLVSH